MHQASAAGPANNTLNAGSNVTQSVPALAISNFSVPGTAVTASPLPLSFTITDNSGLALINISANISSGSAITGSRSLNLTPLSPGQSETAELYLSNYTATAGAHALNITIGYSLNGTVHYLRSSGSYDVASSDLSTIINSGNASEALPGLAIDYIPAIIYLNQSAGSFASQISLGNTGSSQLIVNLSVPSKYSSLLTLSARSLYISKGQHVSLNEVFRLGRKPTNYVIPLNITEYQSSGRKYRYTFPIDVFPYNYTNGMPSISGQISLINHTNDAAGILIISGAANYALNQAELEVLLPSGVALNAANISTYGSQADISRRGRYYSIRWPLGNFGKNQSVYYYYNVTGLLDASALSQSQFMLTYTTPLSQNSVINITGVEAPSIPTNSSSEIFVDMLYTGGYPTNVVAYATSPTGISVKGTAYQAYVTPNSRLRMGFNITTGSASGTQVLSVNIAAGGVNSAMDIYVPVLPAGILPSTKAPPKGLAFSLQSAFEYLLIGILLIIIVVALAYRLRGKKGKSKYMPDIERELIEIREDIENYHE